jgi:hypothetical protein
MAHTQHCRCLVLLHKSVVLGQCVLHEISSGQHVPICGNLPRGLCGQTPGALQTGSLSTAAACSAAKHASTVANNTMCRIAEVPMRPDAWNIAYGEWNVAWEQQPGTPLGAMRVNLAGTTGSVSFTCVAAFDGMYHLHRMCSTIAGWYCSS